MTIPSSPLRTEAQVRKVTRLRWHREEKLKLAALPTWHVAPKSFAGIGNEQPLSASVLLAPGLSGEGAQVEKLQVASPAVS